MRLDFCLRINGDKADPANIQPKFPIQITRNIITDLLSASLMGLFETNVNPEKRAPMAP